MPPPSAPASTAPPAAAPRLLTLRRVCDLFCNRLGIAYSTYHESHRPFLPVVYTRMMPVRGRKGEYRPGSPRLREDVARELVEIAATGGWQAYVEEEMRETHPHLYLKTPGTR